MISAISPTAAKTAAPDAKGGAKHAEKGDFSTLLDLGLTLDVPAKAAGKGNAAKLAVKAGAQDSAESDGNPAMPGGNILPVDLPLGVPGVPVAKLEGLEASTTAKPGLAALTAMLRGKTAQSLDPQAQAAAKLAAQSIKPDGTAEPAAAVATPALPGLHLDMPLPAAASQAAAKTAGTEHAAKADDKIAPSAAIISSRAAPVVADKSASGDAQGNAQSQAQGQNQNPSQSGTDTPSPAGTPARELQHTAAKTADAALPATAASAAQAAAPTPAMTAAPHTDAAPVQAATFTPHARDTGGQDIATLVESIAQARESASGQVVRTVVRHEDFGLVSLQFRSDDARLSVSMTSADPDFAPAVQAASASAHAGQGNLNQGNLDHGSHNSRQDAQGQSQSGSNAALAGQSQGQAQNQTQAQQHNHQPGAQGEARGQRTAANRTADSDGAATRSERGDDGIYA